MDVNDEKSSRHDELADLLPGGAIGPYTIIDRLGRGGMGQVFLANDSRLSRKVALKCLLSGPDAPSDLRWRVIREARAAARISHPNVATVHDVVEHRSRAFIVMEYVDGESLAARLQRARLPIDGVVAVGRQLASALTAAHAQGIVHRDLKPSNIQVARDGSIKVIDFGIAKTVTMATTATALTVDAAGAGAGADGPQSGTLGYMSPEQMLGREVGPRSDLFSLGAVLFEMATGRRLFTSTQPLHVIAAMSQPLPRAAEIDRRVPTGLSDVIARALATDPDQRFQSAAEFESALVELDRSGDTTTSREQTPAPAPADDPGTSEVTNLRGRLILARSPTDLLRLKYEVEQYLATRPSDVEGRLLNDSIDRALTVGFAESAGVAARGRLEPSSRARWLRYATAGGLVAVIAIAGSIAVVMQWQRGGSLPMDVRVHDIETAPPSVVADPVSPNAPAATGEAAGVAPPPVVPLESPPQIAAGPPPPNVVGPPSALAEPETPGIPRMIGEALPDYLNRAQRIEANLKAGRSALDKRDFATALSRLRQVDRDQKGYRNIEALIADTVVKQRAAFDQAIDDGQKNEEANRLLVARQWYQRAAYYDPNAAIARERDVLLMNKMLPEATRLFNQASFEAKSGATERARRTYQLVLDMTLPGDEIRERTTRELATLK